MKFPQGTFELIAIAEDGAGLITESAPVVVQVGMVVEPEDTGAVPTTSAGSDGSETGVGETGAGSASATATATDTVDTADMAGDGDGCGCRSRSGAPAGWLLLILPIACRRRRDSRVA